LFVCLLFAARVIRLDEEEEDDMMKSFGQDPTCIH